MVERADVVVVGGGLAGMIAAIECAKVGLDVRVISDPVRHGSIRSGQLGEITGVDFGAESFASQDEISQLCAELGIETETLLPRHTLLNTGLVTASIPATVVAGIPGEPFTAELSAFAPRAKLRAYADRVMPVLKIGEAHNLGSLVRQRLGSRIVEGFTDPYCRAVFGLPAIQVELTRAAPHMNSTMTSLGTLSGAALALSERPESAERVVGGLQSLFDAVRARAENYAVRFEPANVSEFHRVDDEWRVHIDTSDGQAPRELRTHTVIAAVDPRTVGRPIDARVAQTAREVRVVTAIVSSGQAPRATGILWADDEALVSAAVPSMRSRHLSAQLQSSHEILRVVTRDVDVDPERTVRDAADLLAMEPVSIHHLDSESWTVLRPWVGLEDPEPEEVHADETGTLEWVGQWAAGSGLARVARHAHKAAHRIRTRALELKLNANA